MSILADGGLKTLSEERAELLTLLLEERSRQAQSIRSYPRGDGVSDVLLPTSSGQQRLWFIDQLEGGSAGYSNSVALRLQGALDQEALQKALNTLVQRHEVLRTLFVNVQGDPMQKIVSEGRFALKVIDLSAYEEPEREGQVRLQEVNETHGKFDLSVGPLIRGRLLRLQAEEHVLLITMHHIVSDGWSMGVLLREFSELYRAYREGRGDPLEPLPIQYADYAQWQQERLHGEALEQQLSYWRARLDGAPVQLELPTDRPRPAVQSFRGENVGVVLDAKLSAALKALAQRHEMTLFMVLLAGWAILLSRLSGQDDVVIGTPIANRRRTELEGLIGFLVNTLVLRVGVRGVLSVEEFLHHVKEVTLGAFDHQDLPFERVVEALQPQRSLSRNPLFQVSFALQSALKCELLFPGLSATLEDGVDGPATFDLQLVLEEQGNEIVGSMNYFADVFDRETVKRWMACWEHLLKGMVTNVRGLIGQLPILPTSEQRQVIELFNATRVAYPEEKLVHELFEEQVERTPEAVAVEYEGQSLTYAELNGRADQLARYLRGRGVRPDQLVGICVERSLEMVVGLLGILKAGGAYVPLDPNYPPERLAYMLEDAAPKVLLTQGRLKGLLPEMAAEVVALDSDWRAIAEQADTTLHPCSLQLSSRHLAYVIYTSGSTGQPKGAMNEHRGVVNRLLWMQGRYGLNAQDRVLQKTPFSFDVSVWEFFWTLMSGARLILSRPRGHRDPSYLRKLIEEAGVTTLHFVPSMLQSFLDQHQVGWCKTVRHVVCSGEELSPALQNKCLERLPGVRLSNLYGPTEAAVDVTAWECQLEEHSNRVPIGRPISNIQMYLLDSNGQPVPIGVAAEIYIGGVGVGRGYFKRPELTATRFVADPFSGDPDARMYKTGDLGRWRVDGAIEYLGRNDHQVKIRGFRIELGEIEAQLARHGHVKEVAVIAREDVPGEKRLVAYLTRRDQSDPSIEDLRAYLTALLPDYMVPSAFVILESLPLTPNGKLDRQGLPAPELGAHVSRQYEAPQGDVEEILAGIWKELLSLERVGRKDNFFELGGHSLLATRMISRMRDLLHVEVTIRALFDTQTMEQLAAHVRAEVDNQEAQERFRVGDLVRDIRQQIHEMDDAKVLARISELERELGS